MIKVLVTPEFSDAEDEQSLKQQFEDMVELEL
jgi:hypothetical protein